MTTDHEGNNFRSVPEMCRHWGIAPSTYGNRISRGWTVEQALTVPTEGHNPKVNHQKPIQDHLGNWYGCVRELAEAYGITEKVYWSRKRICKWPLEKILTTPVNDTPPNAVSVSDHLGQEFPSVSHMCRHWHVGLSTYRERRKRGWDVGPALTGQKKMAGVPKAEPCQDHLGNWYPSKAAMCTSYGKTRYCVQSRLDAGWSLEKALCGDYVVNAKPCADHIGRSFPSAKDMANFLGLPPHAFQKASDPATRIPALAKTYWEGRRCGQYLVKQMVSFPWFLVTKNGSDLIANFERILEEYHTCEMVPVVPNKRLRTLRLVRFPWYLVELDGEQLVMNYWRLIEKNASLNFGLAVAGPDQKNSKEMEDA